jgi:hypothetical protein
MVLLLERDNFGDLFEFSNSFEYLDKNGQWSSQVPRRKSTRVKEITDLDHPYHPYNLQTQARRVKPSFDQQADCNCPGASNAWLIFACVEQSCMDQILYPLPQHPMQDHISAPFQHQCSHMFDFPIGFTTNDQQGMDIYCNTHFPVRVVPPVDNPSLDIYPRFRFFEANFAHLITPQWIHNFQGRLAEDYKDGYLLDVWASNANDDEAEEEEVAMEEQKSDEDPLPAETKASRKRKATATDPENDEPKQKAAKNDRPFASPQSDNEPPQQQQKSGRPSVSGAVFNIGEVILNFNPYGSMGPNAD